MLKVAYQLGVQAAFEEAGLTKEAQGKAGLFRRAWEGFKGLSPAKKALLGGGLGAGALGTAAALWPREEEPTWYQRVGSATRDIFGNRELMHGLTQSLAGMGGAGLGLTPGDAYQSFPPAPQGLTEADIQQMPQTPMQQPEQYAAQYPEQYPEQYAEQYDPRMYM